jgi:hypothetical protein
MRNLINEAPSLFPTNPIVIEPARSPEPSGEKKPESIAREFVKWCCGFGSDFRNSPDYTNLRFWCEKVRMRLDADGQQAVLVEAQKLFARKLEQLMRKADASLPQMNTMSE